MKVTTKNKIITMLNKGMSPKQISKKLGCTVSYVYSIRWDSKTANKKLFDEALKAGAKSAPDMVNHPPHYTAGGIETIDFIEAKKLGYNLGNVIKYITRSDLKGSQLEDLEKALWYLNREIKNQKGI